MGVDLRHGLRSLCRTPGFTLVAMLTLALGIGANTAIFSVIQALLLRPLPVPHADRLQQLFIVRPGQRPANAFSYPFVRALADRRDIADGLFGFVATTFAVGEPGGIEQVDGAWVTGQYYETLGLLPARGRLLTAADDRPGAAPVVVISDAHWRRQWGADPRAIGRAITIFGTPVTIVGVTAPGFTGTTVGRVADLTLPLAAAPQMRPELSRMLVTGANMLNVMARKPAGLPGAEFRARLAVAWRQVAEPLLPAGDRSSAALLDARLIAVPGGTGWSALRRIFGVPLAALMALVACVLLIACANVAHLLVARTRGRRREIATRLALGADRGRVIRQLLAESAMLALGGAAVGLLLAWAGSASLLGLLAAGGSFGPSPGPGVDNGQLVLDITPDAAVLAFTMLLAVSTVLLSGTAPAFLGTSTTGLGFSGGASVTRPVRAGGFLVAGQLALTLLMLVCAGLFVRTLQNLRAFDRGFDPAGVLLVAVDARAAGFEGAPLATLYRDLHERMNQMPGVRAASYGNRTPLDPGETSYEFLVNGVRSGEEALYCFVGPGYFRTIRTPLIAGREVTDGDTAAAPRVAIVNETFARRFMAGLNPIGQRLTIDGGDGPPLEVVGVVKDALFTSNARYLEAPPTVYTPYAQNAATGATFVVATSGDRAAVASAIERDLLSRLPNSRMQVRTLGQQLDRVLIEERLVAAVATAFGVLAIVLGTVGLYGLLAHNVMRRTVEIGVRAALGATRADVLRLVLNDAARPLAAGILAGLPLAWGASFIGRRMLFGLTPTDPVTALAAVAILLMAGAIAVLLPAYRAARIDPAAALRRE